MSSRIAKARDLYIQGRIEADEFERRVELALAHDPNDPGEHTFLAFTDAPGGVAHWHPPMVAAFKDMWTQPRVLVPFDDAVTRNQQLRSD